MLTNYLFLYRTIFRFMLVFVNKKPFLAVHILCYLSILWVNFCLIFRLHHLLQKSRSPHLQQQIPPQAKNLTEHQSHSGKNNLQEQLTAHIPACSVSSLLFLNTSGSACNILTWPRTFSLSMQANFCSACNFSTPPRTSLLSLQHFHSAKKMEDKEWNLFVVWLIVVRIITQGLQHWSNRCHLRNYCLTNLS